MEEETKKIDKETAKILETGEKMTNFIKGEEWQNIKNMLFKKVGEICSFTEEELKAKSDEEVGKEMKLRQRVIQVVIDWIDEVEGIPSQHGYNMEAFNKGHVEETILRVKE